MLLPLLVSVFLDQVASIIEKKHYPQAKTTSPPLLSTLKHDARFVLKALLLNMLCLPLYIIPLVNVVVYYTLNSYLLGKTFFCQASWRYLSTKQTKTLYASNRLSILAAGFFITMLTNIPILNLVAPLFAIIVMVHVFHGVANKQK